VTATFSDDLGHVLASTDFGHTLDWVKLSD
jgi:hypothetical protein